MYPLSPSGLGKVSTMTWGAGLHTFESILGCRNSVVEDPKKSGRIHPLIGLLLVLESYTLVVK